MAKRFTDTQKFNDKWYRGLSLLQKTIWEYLLAECNHAGILEKFDPELITFKIGAQVSIDDIKSFGQRIIFVSDEILFIPNFIKFQYEVLNPQNRVHASVLKELKKYNLEAPCMVLESPFEGSKDKDKNKNKDKEEDRVQGEGEELKSSIRFELEYEKVFGVRPILDENQASKLDKVVSLFADFWEFLPLLLQFLKEKTFNFRDGTTRKADLGWLFKNSNLSDLANEANLKYSKEKLIKQAECAQGKACFIVQGAYNPELREYEGPLTNNCIGSLKAEAIHWWPGDRLDCPNRKWLEGVF